jgi:hypothetical protein
MLAQSIGVGVLAGVVAGLLVGAASRLAMRIVTLVAGTPAEFTLVGTLGILVIVALASIFPGIFYALTRRFLRWPEAARGLLFGVAMLLVIGVPFFYGALSNGELSRGPLDFGRGLFALLFLLFGLTLGLVTGWLTSRLPAPRRSVGSVAGYSALLLAAHNVFPTGWLLLSANASSSGDVGAG